MLPWPWATGRATVYFVRNSKMPEPQRPKLSAAAHGRRGRQRDRDRRIRRRAGLVARSRVRGCWAALARVGRTGGFRPKAQAMKHLGDNIARHDGALARRLAMGVVAVMHQAATDAATCHGQRKDSTPMVVAVGWPSNSMGGTVEFAMGRRRRLN